MRNIVTALCPFIVLCSLSTKLISNAWFPGQCHQRSVSSETGRANSWLQWLVGDGNKYIGHVVRPQEMKSMVNFLMEADTIA